MKELSIIISSCNRYHYLWDIQLQLFDKYWGDCPYNIYYVSENSELPTISTNLKLHNFNVKNAPMGASDWSYMLQNVLKYVESEYVLYMQEDYIFTNHIHNLRFESVFKYIKTNDINYLRFYTGPPGNGKICNIDTNTSIREILPESSWRGNLMLALWKKNTLLSLVNGLNITPWQFEHTNTNHFDKFYCINLPTNDCSDILPFLGMYGSSNGFTFYPEVIELLTKHQIKKLDGTDIDFNIKL